MKIKYEYLVLDCEPTKPTNQEKLSEHACLYTYGSKNKDKIFTKLIYRAWMSVTVTWFTENNLWRLEDTVCDVICLS